MRGQRKNPRKAVQPFENKKRKIDIFKNYEANGVEKIQRKLEIFSTLISKKSKDFGTTERISYLPKPLSLGTAPRNCDPQKGDIAYYIPWGNLAVFVRDFRPSDNLVPLGKLSSKSLEAIQESGSKDVEISLVK